MNHITPQWLQPARTITGQDHLGIQAYSISFYGQLFPGMTNLTQRVRYYSLYPWFLSNYVKLIGIKNNRTKWRDFLRRCEFLYALIAVYESDEKSVVGSQLAKKVLLNSNNKIDFSLYTDLGKNSAEQYWAQSFGGYGQYYLGSLQTLDIIFFDEKNEIEYLGDNGKQLVLALDEVIPLSTSKKFYELALAGKVSKSELKNLSQYLNPSKIDANSNEGKILRKILIESKSSTGDQYRSGSLRLLINILNQNPSSNEINYDELRFILLHKSFTNGNKFIVPGDLSYYSDKWTAFFIGELLNYSLETLFWSTLQIMKSKNNLNLNQLADEVVDTLVKKKESYKLLSKLNFDKITIKDFLISVYNQIKIDDNYWFNKKFSTYNLIDQINESISEHNISDTVYNAIILFAKLYSQYQGSKELLDVYGPGRAMNSHFPEMNPYTILNYISNNAQSPAKQGLREMLKLFILQRHCKVALNKLRIPPQQSTFKFIIRDSKLEWLEDIEPTFTGPRLKTAINFLEDLGLVVWGKNKVTQLGKDYLN